MSFGQAISTCFHKYAVFKGRARRSEFWFFSLFINLANILITIIYYALTINHYSSLFRSLIMGSSYNFHSSTIIVSILFYAAEIALAIPLFAVESRRLHDIAKSGWLILLLLIPVIGAIVLIVLFCQEGNIGENRYGPDPKKESFAPQHYEIKRQLLIVSGPNSGQTLPLTQPITMGRDASVCNYIFPSSCNNVSRRHCTVELKHDKTIYIIDHNSTCGTYLNNGTRIPSNVWTPVSDGFYLGSRDYLFKIQ